ncbi:MAG: S8 family serine peptidase [Candidatus Marinimicrobia bacterium]|nr:S8 family serine peptidase [Candidatus Neomarinimicrobiota bacterium]
MKRIVYFFGLTLLFTSILIAAKPTSFNLDPYNPEYDPNTILVKFHDEAQVSNSLAKTASQTGIVSVDRLIGNYSVKSVEKVFVNAQPVFGKRIFTDPSGKEHELKNMDKIYRIKYDANKDPKELSEEIANDPSVEYAEPDYYVYMMIAPDDPFYASGDQWHIDAVNAPAAWDSTTADTNQVISIIDTGVDWDHPDLDSKIWINRDELDGIEGVDDDGNGYIDDIRGWDFINDDNDPNDDNSHGTHVAGIAAAETNNAVGVAGIAWNAKIMPIKILQSSGSGSSSDLAAGIDYAAQNGATVINMSLGSYGESYTVKTACENAYAYAVLIAAAGNDGYKVDPPFPPYPPYAPMYPACYGFVLGVEASTETGGLAAFSNYDPSGPVDVGNAYNHNYEVRAPGTDIYSTFPNGNYRDLSGTSMATPIVSGTVALMKTYNASQSTEQIFARLIQSANNGILDIENALGYVLQPDLCYLEYTLIDTLPGCDGDGIADAGETIEIYLTVKNAGGKADSVWSKLRFGEFEDESIATITDSTSYIGDISAYAQLTGEPDPFTIVIAADIANNRDVVFECEIGDTEYSTIEQEIIIPTTNGEELSGVMDTTLILTPDKLWIVNNSFRVGAAGQLTVLAGTEIELDEKITVRGQLDALGTQDSMITISGPKSIVILEDGVANFHNVDFNNITENFGKSDIWGSGQSGYMNFYYCNFNEFLQSNGQYPMFSKVYLRLENCVIRNSQFGNLIYPTDYSQIYLKRNNISNCKICLSNIGLHMMGEMNLLSYNNFSKIMGIPAYTNPYGAPIFITNNDWSSEGNNFLTFDDNAFALQSNGSNDIIHVTSQYWGALASNHIDDIIFDFWDDSDLPLIDYDTPLSQPSDSAHGCIWKVEVNDVLINKYDNPYDDLNGLGFIGSETLKFDVYFNRSMDTTITPFLTFGVREPYTQRIVNDSVSWSSDSTVWTAYFDVDDETGDGIQRVRVTVAEDPEHFEIPIEDSRFEFVIQAASAAGVQFTAEAGIGKVDLEWAKSAKNKTLGYNAYRYEAMTDSTWSDTTLLNDELIIDTLYTDYDVIPDSTYCYLFTQVQTDMSEGDYSKKVTATVLSAPNGDANGDLNVNVLDVITMVNYILEGEPNPFLFDAADINGDGNINVLDIIGVVNVILNPGMGKAAFTDATETVFYLKDNKIYTSSNGALGGYQFIVNGDIDELKISSEYPMEVATAKISEDELLVLVYSLSGQVIPEGDHAILTLTNTEDLTFNELIVADHAGRLVFSNFGVYTDIVIPTEFALNQNYPNPFNASTTLSYQLPKMSDVNLSIYNILGQKVYEQSQKGQRAGYYSYHWDGLDNTGHGLASGVYIYKIVAGEFTDSKKMILMK